MSLTRLEYSLEHPGFPGIKPLLLTSFADDGISARDGQGQLNTVTGLYAALSFDEGKTWPAEYRRVISNMEASDELEFEAAPWQRTHTLTKTEGQEDGYITATQSPDGTIYITDGKIVYDFNLAWLMDGAVTSLNETGTDRNMRIFPNLGNCPVSIEVTDDYTGMLELKICSIDGRTLLNKNTRKENHTFTHSLDLDLAPGAYLVSLNSGAHQYISWFIRQ
jgi:hypothetical protein